MLRILGGENRSVELKLAKKMLIGLLQIEIERWTSRGPFVFKLEAKDGNVWKEILSKDAQMKTGSQPAITISFEKPVATDTLRFTVTSASGGGMLVKSLFLGESGKTVFIGLESENLKPITTPVLIDGKGTTVQKLDFQILGGELKGKTELKVRLQNTELLQSAGIRFNGKIHPITPLKNGLSEVKFEESASGNQAIELVLEPKDNAKLAKTVGGGIEEIKIAGIRIIGETDNIWPIARLLLAPGQGGVHTYRIPGMVTSSKGTLLAVYDFRYKHSGDLPADIDVGLSRSTDGGETWEEPRVIINFGKNDPKEGVGDPAILLDEKTGRIWVAALWAHGGHSLATSKSGLKFGESGQLILSYSDDDGITWSKPRNITPELAPGKDWKILFNGPGNGITMQDGTLVFAAQYWDAKHMPYSTIVYSKDRGETWHVGTGARSNTTEAQVVELSDGSLMLNMRDNRGGSRAVMTTKDLGQTWTDHPSTRSALPESVCQASILRISSKKDGDKTDSLAFLNPNVTRGRYNMTVQISDDDGLSWTRKILVYEPNCYGYSSISLIDKETLAMIYETSGGLIFQKIKLR